MLSALFPFTILSLTQNRPFFISSPPLFFSFNCTTTSSPSDPNTSAAQLSSSQNLRASHPLPLNLQLFIKNPHPYRSITETQIDSEHGGLWKHSFVLALSACTSCARSCNPIISTQKQCHLHHLHPLHQWS